ncbi:MAG: hypothetical protein P4N60_01815 [Verrucomicrobiae bacterium]|nr:hypothetical protein [Verrucomicrobiae bacterium]
MKKLSLFAILLVTLVAPGCSWFKHSQTVKPAKPASAAPKTIVTPDMSLAAKVISVNTVGRFVVLSFPAEQMPKLQQTLFLYRMGMKVAEVKVTGPQQENNIVADLVTGDPKVGDTVRAE